MSTETQAFQFPWKRGLFLTLCSIFLLTVVAIGGQLVVYDVLKLAIPSFGPWLHTPMGNVLGGEIAYVVAGAAAIALGWLMCGRQNLLTIVRGRWEDVRGKFRLNIRTAAQGWFMMTVATIVSMILLVLLVPHAPRGENSATVLEHTLTGLPWLLFAIFGAITAPICEELLMRGFFYNMVRSSLLTKWSRFVGPNMANIIAIVISAAFFSAAHLSIGSFIPLFWAGVFLAWTYYRTGNIYGSMTMHMMLNTLAALSGLLGHH